MNDEIIAAIAQKRLDWRNSLSQEDRLKSEQDEAQWTDEARREEIRQIYDNADAD